jgi:hypothetical protein
MRSKPMRKFMPVLTGVCTVVTVLMTGCGNKPRSVGQAEREAITPQISEARTIAEEAYIYGYPLVTMEMTRRVMTNVATPGNKHAPLGQFALMREYPTAAFREVTAPNADTLYSIAWLDLSREPYILSIPDAHGRYYLMPMLDAWTTVFQVPGTRTTGTKAQKYAITGPGWHGTLHVAWWNTHRPRTLYGLSAGHTVPAHLRTTNKSMPFRTDSLSYR